MGEQRLTSRNTYKLNLYIAFQDQKKKKTTLKSEMCVGTLDKYKS